MTVSRTLGAIVVAAVSLAIASCAPNSGSTLAPTIGAAPSAIASAEASLPIVSRPSYHPVPEFSGSPSASGRVSSPAQAAALVFASNPLFAQIRPANRDAAGQSASYTASASGNGFAVAVTMGSGDCLAGCINSHTWNYSVSATGDVGLVSESGDVVEVATPTPSAEKAQVTISLVAGPVCPVERNSPDPDCAPRPVVGAQVVVRDPNGAQVASAAADQSGQVVFELPTGAYYAEASAANGLMRQPEPAAFSIVGGSTAGFSMEYDTGIR